MFVVGVDVGTEGTKVAAVDESGTVRYKAYRSYSFDVVQSGWTEQDPALWWNALCAGLHDLWAQGLSPHDVRAIGVAGQMHSSVILDAKGAVIRKSILWNDVRTKTECDTLLARIGQAHFQGETCNSLLPGFTLGKLLWLRDHEPTSYAKIAHVLMPKDYVNYRLTSVFSADVTDASGTGLFDVRRRTWHTALMQEIGIPATWFPNVHESRDVIGEVSSEAAASTGLMPGTVVVAGAADNAAAAVGTGITDVTRGLVSVGTSGVVLACLTKAPSYEEAAAQNPTLHVFCHAIPDTWYAMGVTLAAGASLRWFRDALCQGESYDRLMDEASHSSAGSDGLMYLPFLAGERTPHNSESIRGAFLGAHLGHGRGHFARSVIEGVSYSLRDCLELIRAIPSETQELVLTGGAVNSALWSQVIADVLDIPILLQGSSEGAAYGAAILAAMSQGWNVSAQAAPATGHASSLLPEPHVAEAYRHYYAQYQSAVPLAAQFGTIQANIGSAP